MERPKDDLKWFGEGFDGFPKRLPEDCVEYVLFIIDARLSQREIHTRLEAVRREASKLTDKLLKEYIWQRDSFALGLAVDSSNGLKHLHGLTNYGDSVEDEWLIVYLLRELSAVFPDLWIKVIDTDGEFLLIEAANALPRWLNPEIADNRVWINNNKLRIIPLAATSTTNFKTLPVSRSLSQDEAHTILSNTPDILIHSPLMEAEAFYRLRNYPAQINDALHHALVAIPRKLAYFVHNCPASISPAIEAFYLRDPVALKPLTRPSPKDVLILPPEDLITTSIKFTKVLYAQIKSQQFNPPQVWREILSKTESQQQPNLAHLELGIKVTSGYEMLLSDPKNADNRSVRMLEILSSDLSHGETLPTDAEIQAWKDSNRSDSESWLDINFADFEAELAGKKASNANNDFRKETRSKGPEGAIGPDLPHGFGDAKTQKDLQKLVQRFESFMNDEDAGVDGAEVDDMDFDNEDEDNDEDESDSEDEDKEVSFDEMEFQRMMREMMGLPPLEIKGSFKTPSMKTKKARFEELEDSDDQDSGEENEAEELRKVMERMEAELNEAGALDLDPTPKKLSAVQSRSASADERSNNKGKGKSKILVVEEDSDSEDEEGEINVDFNLAKNLLESFKSQAGMAGPSGNLMGMLGMQFPRDEGQDDDDDDDGGHAPIRAGEMGRRIS